MYAVYLKKNEPSAAIVPLYTCDDVNKVNEDVETLNRRIGKYAKVWYEEVPSIAEMSPEYDRN